MKEILSLETTTTVGQMCDKIEEMFELKPDKRKKKEWEIWKNEINSLILQVNTDKKIYNIVK